MFYVSETLVKWMLELFGIRNLRGCKRRDNKVNSERKKQKATINIQELWQQETMKNTFAWDGKIE